MARTGWSAKALLQPPLDCIMDADQYHWKCLAYVRQGGNLYRLSTNITCDKEPGQCLSEPQALTPA